MSITTLTSDIISNLTRDAPSWTELVDVSEVVCITGMKRHGKSALTYYLAEELQKAYTKPIHTWGIPLVKQPLFPKPFSHFTDLFHVQSYYNGIITLDEIHRRFSARRALSQENIEFSDIMTFSGQNNQLLILSTLNNGLIDINTFRIANPILIYKRVGNLQAISERTGIRKFTEQAKNAWKEIPRGRKNTPERSMETKLCYIISEQFIGWMQNPQPDWWNDDVSEMHSQKLKEIIDNNGASLKASAMLYQADWLEFCVKKAQRETGGFKRIKTIQKAYPIEKFYVEHILKETWDC